MAVLKKLSQESGIPQKTLYRWWKELENLKNETNDVTTENDDKNDKIEQPAKPVKKCIRCYNSKVEINSRTKMPFGKDSVYYGLCTTCRKEQKAINDLDKVANKDNGIMTICPKCNYVHYINKERMNE